jgi:hypothetical protein
MRSLLTIRQKMLSFWRKFLLTESPLSENKKRLDFKETSTYIEEIWAK